MSQHVMFVFVLTSSLHVVLILGQKNSTCGVPSQVNSTQQNEIVAAHNYWRAMEMASNMMKLKWNADLAARAQQLSDTCAFAHDLTTDCAGNDVGQNLAQFSGVLNLNMSKMVQSWAVERALWNFKTDQCTGSWTGCGHWTQLVWATTSEIGCGYTRCPKSKTFVVCNYAPAGNVEGVKLFATGDPCSGCTDVTKTYVDNRGYRCENNLCIPCTPSTDKACACGTPDTCKNGGTWSVKDCKCTCVKGYYGTQCDKSCMCQNTSKYCNLWQAKCTDPAYREFMKTNCQLLCNMCEHPPECL